jgi:hypothetical protein
MLRNGAAQSEETSSAITENCYQPDLNTCYWMEQRILKKLRLRCGFTVSLVCPRPNCLEISNQFSCLFCSSQFEARGRNSISRSPMKTFWYKATPLRHGTGWVNTGRASWPGFDNRPLFSSLKCWAIKISLKHFFRLVKFHTCNKRNRHFICNNSFWNYILLSSMFVILIVSACKVVPDFEVPP